MTYLPQERLGQIFSLIPGSIYLSATALWFIWSIGLLKRDISGASRLFIPGLGFLFLPPLIAFTLYFCLWHSWPHFREEWQEIKGTFSFSSLRILFITSFITLLTFIGLGALSLILDQGTLDPALLRMIFLGLLCLTVPHMLLSQIQRH
jgi:Brp/Blh family beta-carotene 15,15'-monooxygenase